MRTISIFLVALFLSGSAFAHTGAGDTSGFVHGVAHPLGGIDHLLAMVAVGILAWTVGGRGLWLVPAAFLTMMAFGAALPFFGVSMPSAELLIGLSVIVIGGLVAWGGKQRAGVAATVVGAFAMFHGFAHGAEMAAGVSGLTYGAGFLVATTFLHAAGLLAACAAQRLAGFAPRVAGAALCAAGAAIVGGVF